MRVKTSSALRAVDLWRERIAMRYRRFTSGMYFLLIRVGFNRELTLPLLITVALSLHFFALEAVSFLVLGFFFLKLQSYRFVNLILRLFSRVGRQALVHI